MLLRNHREQPWPKSRSKVFRVLNYDKGALGERMDILQLVLDIRLSINKRIVFTPYTKRNFR